MSSTPALTSGMQLSEPEEREFFDPRKVILILRRRWPWLVGVVLTALVIGAALTAFATPQFQAVATVALDLRTQQVVSSQQVLGGLPGQKDVVDTEVEILRSPQIQLSVVNNLHLDQDATFNGDEPPHGLDAIKANVRALFGGKALSNDTPADKIQNALNTLQNNTKILRRGLTYVIDISYMDESADVAARVANAYVQAYLSSQLADKVAANQQATKWLGDRVGEMKGQVTAAEQSEAQYQADKGLLTATGSGLTEQRVSQLMQEESAARADLAEKEARLSAARRQIAQGGTGEELGQALSSPVIMGLRSGITAANQKQTDLLTRYGPKHPDVVNSQHEIGQLQNQIREEIKRIIGGLESDVSVSRSRLATVDASLGEARGSLASAKGAQVGLAELDRNAQAKRSLYQSYLDRLQQTSTQTGLARPDATVVAPATPPPLPATPNVKLNMALSLLVGLCGGLALIVLLDLLEQNIQTSTQVEQKLGEPSAGSVPLLRAADGAPIDYVLAKPLSGFAEAFRKLRVYITHRSRQEPVKVIAITSALPKEGKTTMAFCMARSLAQAGFRTVVVDCDTRVRSLSRLAGVNPERGLVSVLSGECSLAEAMRTDAPSGADVLAIGGGEQTPKDSLAMGTMDTLLAQLKAEYDFVLLDCPPALAVSDALSVAAKADGVLFLVRWAATSSRAADYALAALRTAGADILGVALTQVDMRAQSRYGYGDANFFYKQYASYYTE